MTTSGGGDKYSTKSLQTVLYLPLITISLHGDPFISLQQQCWVAHSDGLCCTGNVGFCSRAVTVCPPKGKCKISPVRSNFRRGKRPAEKNHTVGQRMKTPALYFQSSHKQVRQNFLRAPNNAANLSHTMRAISPFLYPALQCNSKAIFHDTWSDYGSVFLDSW